VAFLNHRLVRARGGGEAGCRAALHSPRRSTPNRPLNRRISHFERYEVGFHVTDLYGSLLRASGSSQAERTQRLELPPLFRGRPEAPPVHSVFSGPDEFRERTRLNYDGAVLRLGFHLMVVLAFAGASLVPCGFSPGSDHVSTHTPLPTSMHANPPHSQEIGHADTKPHGDRDSGHRVHDQMKGHGREAAPAPRTVTLRSPCACGCDETQPASVAGSLGWILAGRHSLLEVPPSSRLESTVSFESLDGPLHEIDHVPLLI